MKNIYIYTFLLVIMLFSCTKEIEFGTDFDFNVAVPAKTDIVYKDVYRDMEISLIDILSKSESNYTIDYEEIVGTVNVKVDDFELLKGTFRELPFLLSKSIISVKPTSLGLLTFKLKVKNNLGLIKEFTIQLNVVEFPNTYNFETKKNTIGNPLAGSTVDIGLIITNTGNPIGNSYKIKYSTSFSGIFKIGSLTLNSGEYNPIDTGVTGATYTSTIVGEHKISITVVNLQGTEKKIDIIINYLPNPLVIEFPVSDLIVKETIAKSFEMNISNTTLSYSYQIKFTTNTNINTIISNPLGNVIPLNTFVPLQSKNGSFIYSYLTNQGLNENVTVIVKDQNNLIVSAIFKTTVNPKPVIKHIITSNWSEQSKPIPHEPIYTTYYSSFNFDNITTGPGETIIEYVLNGKSYSVKNSLIPPTIANGTAYTARVKDSSGRWSNDYVGVWGVN